MGFHAKSAEEMYRYVLRLDGERSLTDRFGFSIVLVNDNSPVCRDFASRYFVDLCHRTADRIRFVFLADLPQAAGDDLANVANRGGGGLVGRILYVMGTRQTRGRALGEERDDSDYRTLRPHFLTPEGRPEDTLERLGFDKDGNSAILR